MLANGFHCLVNWEQVCRPKSVGGIRIRNFKLMNSVLLMKSFWSFYNSKSLPWVQLLRRKHYKRRTPCAGGAPPKKCSPLWKGVLSTSGPFILRLASPSVMVRQSPSSMLDGLGKGCCAIDFQSCSLQPHTNILRSISGSFAMPLVGTWDLVPDFQPRDSVN